MLIGPRAASIPIQLVALLLGIGEGVLLYATVIGVSNLVLPNELSLPITFLTVAFCAYFLAAPATWRGLGRRALLIIAVSLLGFAVLGYLVAFLLLRGTPMRGSMPSLVLPVQGAILVAGVGALVGYLLLRERKQRDYLDSATIPAPESAIPSGQADQQS